MLYVPATQLDLVSKYIGGGEDAQETKKLSKLGGRTGSGPRPRRKRRWPTWPRADPAVRPAPASAWLCFSPDSPWQREFEEQFEYSETDDQLRCIGEIKRDMERPVPMDRLLCGDVGYGKTEVALRAVMKCILDGKQAAILVPTTVLAQQH